jgi:hypothetical protein
VHFFGGGEILGLAVADIGFGRSLIRPIRSGLDSNTGYASRFRNEASSSVFLQEVLDDGLDLAIVVLPKVVVSNSPFGVDEKLGGQA